MTIVNLYGNQEEIDTLRAVANGGSSISGFNIPASGGHVRTNSNTDESTTIERLESAGVKVTSEKFKRDASYVAELTARF